ncbi:hypothetical protein Lal_00050186 [Lupinus albus]|nr:hypothetical protein Lal_00050186 [Lupinus albus]
MANHVLNYCQVFGIIVLMLAAWNMKPILGGKTCTQDDLGACGDPGQCDQRCKAKHSGGEGKCGLGLCTCYHCKENPPCDGAIGLCGIGCDENCCKAKCADKFKGVGYCNQIGSYSQCACQYDC